MNTRALLLLGLLLPTLSSAESTWNRFRGPNGTGNAETSGLPTTVDAASTLWKAPLGKGWSSPVLWESLVVVTAETAATKRAVIALSATDGKELWRYEVEFVPHKIHNFNSLASSSAFMRSPSDSLRTGRLSSSPSSSISASSVMRRLASASSRP